MYNSCWFHISDDKNGFYILSYFRSLPILKGMKYGTRNNYISLSSPRKERFFLSHLYKR